MLDNSKFSVKKNHINTKITLYSKKKKKRKEKKFIVILLKCRICFHFNDAAAFLLETSPSLPFSSITKTKIFPWPLRPHAP